MKRFEMGPLREEDLPAIAEMLAWSFGDDLTGIEGWIKRSGREGYRVLHEGKRPVACLLAIPMGQFFGGRSVPMTGIAGVGAAPDRRGHGAARALMRATVQTLARERVPLSMLYPATRTLYRDSGYEPAGCRFAVRVDLAAINLRERALELTPITDRDQPHVASIYHKKAALQNGHLDRGKYIWDRIKAPVDKHCRGFMVHGARGPEGYIYLYEKATSPPHHELRITDIAALTPAAGRRLLTFLADHRSMAEHATWFGGPADTLTQMLPEVGFSIELAMGHWMLRITHVEAALAERGYPKGIEAELHLDVKDAIIPENEGRYVLRVAGGKGEVRRGGKGRITMDVRGLAPLYSGHLAAPQLARAGLVEGTAAEIDKAALVFTGAAPWTPDGF